MEYKLNYKAGFIAPAPVDVYRDGEFFGTMNRASDSGRVYFNLPPGSYNFSGPVQRVTPFAFHKAIKRPRAQKARVKVPVLKLIYCDNPNLGSINTKTGEIFLDNSLRFDPQARDLVLAHEVAHLKHRSETNSDQEAARAMLSKGYDPQQVVETFQRLRGRRSFDSKRMIEKLLAIR